MTDRPSEIRIEGPRLVLRPLTSPEIDEEWREMVGADPMSITVLPSEAPRARGRGHGREAVAVFTDWLFEHAGAVRVQAPTDPENVAMRTVFDRVGWELGETYREFDRTWVMYWIGRERWEARRDGRATSRASGAGRPRPAP